MSKNSDNSSASKVRAEESKSSATLFLVQNCAVSLVASLLAILIVRWISSPIQDYTTLVLVWLAFSLAASVIAFVSVKSQKMVHRYTTVRSLARILTAVLIKELLLMAVLLFRLVELPSLAYSILAILCDAMLMVLMLLYLRVVTTVLIDNNTDIREMSSRRSALVMGTGDNSIDLAANASSSGSYNVVGLITDNPNMAGRVICDHVVYYCGSYADVDSLQWKLGGVDAILFPRGYSFSGPDGPEGPDTHGGEASGDIPQVDGLSRAGYWVKRGFDTFGSAFLLIIFSPLLAISALAVKLEDGGPSIYAQQRIGRNGKAFNIYKLRTMRTGAEAADAPALYSGEGDPRLTRVGRFLRAHHLDELPQLWNVLRGDMSFIGYRPERRYFIDRIMEYDPRYKYLFQIRPGVTSYATLYNGYTDTMEKMLTRLELDLYYLRNRSVWFDAKVLGLTFLSIIVGKKF